jgi:hypothetical protein
MNKPSRYEIMRRNRPKLLKARSPKKALRERIDEIERQVVEDWTPTEVEEIRQTEERLALRAELQVYRPRRPQSRLRKLLQWLPGMLHA